MKRRRAVGGTDSGRRKRAIAIALVCVALAAGNAPAQDAVDSSFVTDIDVHIEDGNSYIIFYDAAGNACATSGDIVIYKTVMKFRDQVRLEGRGIDQQFVTERIPYEDYGMAVQKSFTAGDFRQVQAARGKTIIALPLTLSGVRRGESVKAVFGAIAKTITAGY